jgi:hypothetical protein
MFSKIKYPSVLEEDLVNVCAYYRGHLIRVHLDHNACLENSN